MRDLIPGFHSALYGYKQFVLFGRWRPRPELNRGTRFCRPLRNHSATWPSGALRRGVIGLRYIEEREARGNAAIALLHFGTACLFDRRIPQGGDNPASDTSGT